MQDFAKLPDWYAVKLWSSVKRKKLEEINSNATATAILSSIAVNALSSYGGASANAQWRDFLPFKLEEVNSSKAQLTQKLGKTLEVIKRVIDSGSLPPKVIKAIYQVPDLFDLLNEKEV